jgi:hypothetical protein
MGVLIKLEFLNGQNHKMPMLMPIVICIEISGKSSNQNTERKIGTNLYNIFLFIAIFLHLLESCITVSFIYFRVPQVQEHKAQLNKTNCSISINLFPK